MNKNILILGGYGMLGSMCASYFIKEKYEVDVVISSPKELKYSPTNIFIKDLRNDLNINFKNYDFVINCVGAIKQKKYSISDFYYLNSFLPHKLSKLCQINNTKLIQISSDCVFSGNSLTAYEKFNIPDATDDYGISKALGESIDGIVIRTSIIGPANDNFGLFEWFKSQNNIVNGYKNHYWSGLTTLELAKIIHSLIEKECSNNLFQLASTYIDKYNLLLKINDIFCLNKNIIPYETSCVNRTLISDFKIKPIEEQLQELKKYDF
jgi:dTDP-4-dehydrorhamnose reductase